MVVVVVVVAVRSCLRVWSFLAFGSFGCVVALQLHPVLHMHFSFVLIHHFSLLLLVDENSFKKDGPHSCVHCGFPQHSKKPWTKISSLQVSLCCF